MNQDVQEDADEHAGESDSDSSRDDRDLFVNTNRPQCVYDESSESDDEENDVQK